MSLFDIKPPENVTATDTTVKVEPPTLTPAHATQGNAPKNPLFYVPAHWHIELQEDGSIHARHNMLGDVFRGTVAEYKQLMKGV